MTDKVQGKCLCGAVTISGQMEKREIQACHCVQCQTWTGGSPYYVVRIADAVVEGEDHIGHFRASAHGERGFCTTCGTTLFWRMQGDEITSIAAGMLSHEAGLRVTQEIFTDRRADWQPPFDGATQSTEVEEFAKLAPKIGTKIADQA